jgi:Na+/H+ antiporter NhaD/arsenite permease-like protein
MFYLAVFIFVATYVGIMLEKIPRTYISLAGGLFMIFCGYLSQEEAIGKYIDFNTLGLLVGMMMMIGVIRRCGIFEAMAIWAAKVTHGRPPTLLVLLSIITAVSSSLFDSVTAVLLLAPMTISLARQLEIQPYPFLIMEIFISNIGGTALMVGNPPNVMIGSATGLSFNLFFLHLAPGVVMTMLVVVPLLLLIYRKDLIAKHISPERIKALRPQSEIKDFKLMHQSLIVMAFTILGFVLHSFLGIQTAAIAIAGATILMIISRTDAVEAMSYVQWDTLFFFLGLFVLVGGIDKAGVIHALAQEALTLTNGDTLASTSLIIWLSAIVSAFVDNIPFTATMIPLIQQMQSMMGINAEYMWWALAMGACFGGNGTIIGASPNLIIAAIAGREGYEITFMGYMKMAFPLMVVSVLVAHLYIYLRFFVFG